MHNENNSYSAISSARSALASVVSVPGYPKLSDHPLISRFVKGVYNLNPPKPRYTYIWDVNKVFDFIKKGGPNIYLSYAGLTQKLAILLLIYSGQRCSTLTSFDLDYMDLQESKCIFYPNKLLKHSNPNRKIDVFTFEKYGQEPMLCPIDTINEYLVRRNVKANTNVRSLFVTCVKPHNTPHEDTVARWIKGTMKEAGVNTNVFKPHSCRSASTSKGKVQGLPLDKIMKYGSWKNVNTFLKHYCRNVIIEEPCNELQQRLMND